MKRVDRKKDGTMKNAREQLENLVHGMLRREGFKPTGQQRECAIFCRQGKKYSVETKSVPLYRSSEFRSFIGDAILRFRDSGASGNLLLAMRFGRMGSKAESDLREYADLYARDLCWLLIPDKGDAILHLAGLSDWTIPCGTPANLNAVSLNPSSQRSLFSPKSQWLWKSLLMPGIDRRYWGGSEVRPRSVTELAARSGVSQPTVSAFLSRAVRSGFLERETGRLKVINHRELLEDWAHAAKHMRRQVVGARPLYKESSEEALLGRVREYCRRSDGGDKLPPLVVSSHLACHLLRVGRSNQRSTQFHVAGHLIPEIMDALGLVPATDKQATLALVTDGLTDSVNRGFVNVDGVPVADALQCCLDVRLSHARGYEQSEYIYERVLRPHFERL